MRRAAKGPSASDELLEAAMAQAQAERDGIEASKLEASREFGFGWDTCEYEAGSLLSYGTARDSG